MSERDSDALKRMLLFAERVQSRVPFLRRN